ncbi:hypothetical protein [Miltoncostaea oceani]|uniref:hypothetical protein n=1 Tax=Miltoncostaea oceani TaxID=2843216 RepID=UPI001C3CE6B2|nr:hypothetical protein [Miltoncostaea oceani]
MPATPSVSPQPVHARALSELLDSERRRRAGGLASGATSLERMLEARRREDRRALLRELGDSCWAETTAIYLPIAASLGFLPAMIHRFDDPGTSDAESLEVWVDSYGLVLVFDTWHRTHVNQAWLWLSVRTDATGSERLDRIGAGTFSDGCWSGRVPAVEGLSHYVRELRGIGPSVWSWDSPPPGFHLLDRSELVFSDDSDRRELTSVRARRSPLLAA